jgi:hypothetical protein
MYKDTSKPDEFKISTVFLNSVIDIRNSFLAYKDYVTFIGMLLAVTALFLGIPGSDVFLKRIQALLLFLSVFVFSIILITSLRIFIKIKRPEIYYAFAISFIFICGLFIFNLYAYLFKNFNNELTYYLHWLGIPIISIAVNICSIYFFKLIKKYKSDIDGYQLENFFLLILNWNLVSAYFEGKFNFFSTLKILTTLRFHNLNLLITFLLALLSELRPFKGKTKKAAIIETCLFIFVLIFPYLIYYILPKIVNFK